MRGGKAAKSDEGVVVPPNLRGVPEAGVREGESPGVRGS